MQIPDSSEVLIKLGGNDGIAGRQRLHNLGQLVAAVCGLVGHFSSEPAEGASTLRMTGPFGPGALTVPNF